ncbi:hypothetical protein QA640_12275 [Bradyrhizobium sp. CB82]|uniref:hypothetical protein n=1 Tax=Bradyrhizobium sp. CB82 TaxID=3039159 RepID=UPI0024B27478|nr:hypothetical protein [Bradyrhizobium sp. CB82]WFU43150.1 hypothetical protein QA640_12275 [Bradyrhizobium sp. CB82]
MHASPLRYLGGGSQTPEHNYGNAQTLHTIVAEPARRRFLIGIGGDAPALDEDMLDVDFKLWVSPVRICR